MQQNPLLSAIFAGTIGLQTILVPPQPLGTRMTNAKNARSSAHDWRENSKYGTDKSVSQLPISTIYTFLVVNPVFLEGYRDQWRPRMR